MVLEQEKFNKQEFLSLFQKRFFSFCEKSPLTLKFKLFDDMVYVYDLSTDPEVDPIEFRFDFSKDEKTNIKQIKDYLVENNYPILDVVSEYTRKPSAIEIQDMMVKERVSFTTASAMLAKKSDTKKYRVEKVLHSDNRIIIRDLQENSLDMYFVRIPLTIFVREIFNNPQNASDIFVKKCEKIKQVVDSVR